MFNQIFRLKFFLISRFLRSTNFWGGKIFKVQFFRTWKIVKWKKTESDDDQGNLGRIFVVWTLNSFNFFLSFKNGFTKKIIRISIEHYEHFEHFEHFQQYENFEHLNTLNTFNALNTLITLLTLSTSSTFLGTLRTFSISTIWFFSCINSSRNLQNQNNSWPENYFT